MIYKNPKSKQINRFDLVYKKMKPNIPKFPYYVDIELTNNCNCNCKMCPRTISQRKTGYMSETLFKKIVDECEVSRTPIRLIGFGEPLLHPQFKNFITYALSKKYIKVHLTTNGRLLDWKTIETLVNWKVHSIIISFQGLTKEEYQNMRGCSWDVVEENLKVFKRQRGRKNKPYIRITTTIDSINEKDRQSFLKQWLPLVDSISIGKTNWHIVNQKEPDYQKYVQCTEVNRLVQISWDGKVSPCCGDPDDFLTIGNANNESIRTIWKKSKRLECIRELLKDKGNKTLTICSRCFPTYESFD